MSAYTNGSFFGTAVKWLVIGFLAIVALKVSLAVVGAVMGIALALFFTVGPLLLVGWLVLKLARAFARPSPETI